MSHEDTIRSLIEKYRQLDIYHLGEPDFPKAEAALDALVAENQRLRDALDAADWLVTCLQDIRLGKSVRGLPEAFAGFESAKAALAGVSDGDSG